MKWLTVRRWLEYGVFRLLAGVLWYLPVRMQRAGAWCMAFLLCRILPRRMTRYDIAFANIRTSFGEQYSDQDIDRIIFRMWQHLFRLVCEVVQFPRHMSCEKVFDIIEFRNRDAVVRAMCSDRPVILLSGHFGNWETSVATFGEFGFPMGIVARTLDNPHLDGWFRRFRQSTGHAMIDKNGGGPEMQDRLQSGGCVALLADQDAGSRAEFVDFFGRPAATYKSIALLALRYDALVVVGYATRVPDHLHRNGWVRYELGCEAIIDPREVPHENAIHEITQQFTSALECAVRRCPEQYFWVHRRWKSSPAPRRRKADPSVEDRPAGVASVGVPPSGGSRATVGEADADAA